jgi:hypothetical protein
VRKDPTALIFSFVSTAASAASFSAVNDFREFDIDLWPYATALMLVIAAWIAFKESRANRRSRAQEKKSQDRVEQKAYRQEGMLSHLLIQLNDPGLDQSISEIQTAHKEAITEMLKDIRVDVVSGLSVARSGETISDSYLARIERRATDVCVVIKTGVLPSVTEDKLGWKE